MQEWLICITKVMTDKSLKPCDNINATSPLYMLFTCGSIGLQLLCTFAMSVAVNDRFTLPKLKIH